MRMSDYASVKFINLKDVAEGPITGIIAEIGEGDYEKPVITFTSGAKFSLNKTACRKLVDAFGDGDGSSWRGHKIEVFEDTIMVKMKATPFLNVRPIAGEAVAVAPRPPAKPDDLNDDIPF